MNRDFFSLSKKKKVRERKTNPDQKRNVKCKPLIDLKINHLREQDGGGVGGCGVHLSPWIHQEYTFRQTCVQDTS